MEFNPSMQLYTTSEQETEQKSTFSNSQSIVTNYEDFFQMIFQQGQQTWKISASAALSLQNTLVNTTALGWPVLVLLMIMTWC